MERDVINPGGLAAPLGPYSYGVKTLAGSYCSFPDAWLSTELATSSAKRTLPCKRNKS